MLEGFGGLEVLMALLGSPVVPFYPLLGSRFPFNVPKPTQGTLISIRELGYQV